VCAGGMCVCVQVGCVSVYVCAGGMCVCVCVSALNSSSLNSHSQLYFRPTLPMVTALQEHPLSILCSHWLGRHAQNEKLNGKVCKTSTTVTERDSKTQ
jgi:hypothetical protein